MEEFVTLFELFVGIEACNLSYNVVTTILNFRRNSALEEAQKSVNILSKMCNEIHSYYENLMTEKSAYIRGLLCKIEELQKQVKQQPANKCEGCNNAKGCVACVDGSEWAHIEEHNPAWSEEDEEMLRRCISATFDHGYLRECDWLKSLKDRVGCEVNCTTTSEPVVKENKGNNGGISPNSEWSEDDEYNFAFIQEALLGLDGDDSYREKCCKMAEWLESLKPQDRWKPSDEQMYNLRWVGNVLLSHHDSIVEKDSAEKLNSLYKDLKKLKEEQL